MIHLCKKQIFSFFSLSASLASAKTLAQFGLHPRFQVQVVGHFWPKVVLKKESWKKGLVVVEGGGIQIGSEPIPGLGLLGLSLAEADFLMRADRESEKQ